jgi:REP element-mobilizing transposase RayT
MQTASNGGNTDFSSGPDNAVGDGSGPDNLVGESRSPSIRDKIVAATDEGVAATDSSIVGPELLIRKHDLPHWQIGGAYYFITFRSARGKLPPAAQQILMDCLLYGDGDRYDLIAGVVMPDHAHCVIRPKESAHGQWHDLAVILKPIKGVSAYRINRLLGLRGSVWQTERRDRIIRNESEFESYIWYMCQNPVKAGLVTSPKHYPYRIDRGHPTGKPYREGSGQGPAGSPRP